MLRYLPILTLLGLTILSSAHGDETLGRIFCEASARGEMIDWTALREKLEAHRPITGEPNENVRKCLETNREEFATGEFVWGGLQLLKAPPLAPTVSSEPIAGPTEIEVPLYGVVTVSHTPPADPLPPPTDSRREEYERLWMKFLGRLQDLAAPPSPVQVVNK